MLTNDTPNVYGSSGKIMSLCRVGRQTRIEKKCSVHGGRNFTYPKKSIILKNNITHAKILALYLSRNDILHTIMFNDLYYAAHYCNLVIVK